MSEMRVVVVYVDIWTAIDVIRKLWVIIKKSLILHEIGRIGSFFIYEIAGKISKSNKIKSRLVLMIFVQLSV
jgi:hypothetical protein